MQHDYGYFEEGKISGFGDYRLWRRILGFVGPQWPGAFVAVLLALVVTGAGLALPYLVGLGVDRFITGGAELGEAGRFAGLLSLALPFGLLVAVNFGANLLQVLLLEWTGQRVMHRMRQNLFGHLLGLDLGFFSRHPVGRLVTRLTNDIQNMHEMFTSVVVTLFNDALKLAAILGVLFWLNWRLALVMCLLLPLLVWNTVWFSRLARDAFRAIRSRLSGINSFLQETLSGMAVVQLFGQQRQVKERFEQLSAAYLEKNVYQIKVFGLFMPVVDVLGSTAVGLIVWYGGGEILAGRMSIGVLVSFLYYMRLFFQPLREISQKYSIVQSAMASAERIFELLDTKSGLPLVARPAQPPAVDGKIAFESVTFGYDPAQPVLRDFSLGIAPGETVAVVGATGSGKTTVISLLERFHDPQAGRVTLDGRDLRDLEPVWLRRRIGLVMQDVFIVPGSVRENILLDRELSDQEIDTILLAACLDRVVARLPEGLDTRIGEGGMELSAGERQLLALARVLARDPRILVLDEATSSVDSETEAAIEKAIEATLAGRTSIVIAHRLSTIRRAHRIVVMAEGRIVEEGSHAELMARAGLYAHFQSLQNGGLLKWEGDSMVDRRAGGA